MGIKLAAFQENAGMSKQFRCRFMMAIILGCALATGAKSEESDTFRWELGANLPIARIDGFQVTEPGLGIQTSFHLFRLARMNFAADGEADYFPGIHSYDGSLKRFSYWRAAQEVSKSQLVAGIRAGIPWRRTELFARFRPGVFHFSDFTLLHEDSACITVYPAPEGCFTKRSKTRPAIDFGGGILLQASKRWLVRFDVGSTQVHYDLDLLFPPGIGKPYSNGLYQPRPSCSGVSGCLSEWKNHFQAGIGIGFRF